MKVGIIGFPGVGKTTLLAAMTGQDIARASTGRKALVELPDPRLDHLGDVFQPRKFTRARFEIEELPPIPRHDAARRGEVIATLREPDALVVLVGAFEMARLALDESLRDPNAQLAALLDELVLLDLEALEQRLARLTERRDRGAVDKMAADRERTALERLIGAVEEGSEIDPQADEEQGRIATEMRLFAAKAKIAVFNVDEGAADVDTEAAHSSVVCAPVEYEIALIEGEEDRSAFLESYGLAAPASERISRLAFDALDLITFFTVGPDEVRAWPVRRGSDAVTAAGKIHTDLARGFIRAEVTPYERIADITTPAEFKSVGAADVRGKDHIIEDADTINVRFSV